MDKENIINKIKINDINKEKNDGQSQNLDNS